MITDAPLVLVVEDDRATRQSITLALELENYRVQPVSDGAQALEFAATLAPDLLLLDLGLPHIDGLSVCRTLRARGDLVPILVLTARTEVPDRVAGLDAGADDYLAKPFALEELLARARALLRRRAPSDPVSSLQVGDLRIDESSRRVFRDDGEIELTKTEFDLLTLFARNAGIVLSHARVYEEIWGYDFGLESNNLAVYIGYLRRKLEQDNRPRIIHTVRGLGYTLRP